MGCGKLTMELVEKEKARMINYQKRKRGLKKKAEEFAILCGVPTCMIIYGPRLNNRPAGVEVWPEDPKAFMSVVKLYRDQAFSSIRGVKSQNLFNFFADRKRKIDEKIAKTRKANYESKFSGDWDDLNQFSMDQLQGILALFNYNIDVATRKLTKLEGHQILIEDSKSELFVDGSCSAKVAQQLLFHRNMGVDVLNRQQPVSSACMQKSLAAYYPSDHQQHHHHHQALQMLPFDFNPTNNPTMVTVDGGDQKGYFPYIPIEHARYLDPMAAMIDNRLMVNNPSTTVHFFEPWQPYK